MAIGRILSRFNDKNLQWGDCPIINFLKGIWINYFPFFVERNSFCWNFIQVLRTFVGHQIIHLICQIIWKSEFLFIERLWISWKENNVPNNLARVYLNFILINQNSDSEDIKNESSWDFLFYDAENNVLILDLHKSIFIISHHWYGD
jgi:hypothetical protein